MATANTKRTNAKKPTSRTKASARRGWVSRHPLRAIGIPSIFIIVFCCLGIYFINTTHAAPAPCAGRTFGYGSKDSCVKLIQMTVGGLQKLAFRNDTQSYGSLPPIDGGIQYAYEPNPVHPNDFGISLQQGDIDGSFGPITKTSVIAFQKSQPFSRYAQGADGVVGPKTWGALCYAAYKFPVIPSEFGGLLTIMGFGGHPSYWAAMGCTHTNGAPEYPHSSY